MHKKDQGKPNTKEKKIRVLSVKQVGSIASTVRKPQPAQWLIATDGSASPSSVEQPATAGWGFVVDRVGCLSGVEVECWGEVLTDDRDPRALGADSLTNNSGELWALAEAFLLVARRVGRRQVCFCYFDL